MFLDVTHQHTTSPRQEKLILFGHLFFNITVEYNSRRTRGAEEYEDRVRVDTGTVENDEVARSGRTGVATAYIEKMLSRERTMDCSIMHSFL